MAAEGPDVGQHGRHDERRLSRSGSSHRQHGRHDERRLSRSGSSQRHFETFVVAKLNQLQDTLEQEELEKATRRRELHSAAAGRAEARRKSAATASKAAEIEAAINEAQKEAAEALIKRSAEADARMAEREAEAENTRRTQAKRKEDVCLAMLKKQEEIQERAARELAAAAEQRLLENERKEAQLRARLLAEKEALQKRHAEKAAASAAKVERSAKLRHRQVAEQREDFARRKASTEKRMQEKAAAEERRLHEQRWKRAAKKVQLQRAKEHMLGAVEAKRQATLNEEQRKELALQRRAHETEQQRRVRQHERCMMVAAQKQRTEESMVQLQGRLEKLDRMVMMRMERADLLERAKEAQTEQRRHMSRSASLSQHAMSNSLRKIQNNLSNPDLTLALPANVRRNLEKPELRSLFERCDPQGKGTVSVKSVRNLLAEARASMSSSPPGVSQPNKVANVSQRRLLFSYSAGKLLAPATDDSNDERLNMLLQAFNAVDAEGTGSIAKADLYAVLDKAGMTQPGPNAMSSSAFLHTFEGFSNENARMSFDEFVPFASALAKRECAH